MPLPFTPTTGLGRKEAVKPHVGRDLAADQLVELDLIGRRNHFAVSVVDFELRGRNFRMVLLVLKAHRALHFSGGVDESSQRIARQRMIVAAGVDVFELPAFVIVALGVGPLEQEAFNFVGGVERVPLLLVQFCQRSFSARRECRRSRACRPLSMTSPNTSTLPEPKTSAGAQ